MNTIQTDSESLDRLVLLLAIQPREGWEDLFEALTRREVERLAPHPRHEESPTAGLEQVGRKGETDDKENSAYECIIPQGR
jgi:hypothetical protein